jgi:hypothetical protein
MAINPIQPKIIPRLTPITPYEIFLQQVKGTYDAVRYKRRSMDYIPAQMGGIFGQKEVIDSGLVLEITEFEIT